MRIFPGFLILEGTSIHYVNAIVYFGDIVIMYIRTSLLNLFMNFIVKAIQNLNSTFHLFLALKGNHDTLRTMC